MAQTIKVTKRVRVETLKPFPGNPRRGDIAAIADSLRQHGQYRALVVNADGTVLAGNHTLEALKLIEATHALVHFVDVDEDEAKRIVLIDNRTNDLAGYDEGELIALMQSLPELDGTGWTDTHLVEFMATSSPPAAVEAKPAKFELVVTCTTARARDDLEERLTEEGLDCRSVG